MFHKTVVYEFAQSLFICLFNKHEFICLCPVWLLCLNSTKDSVCKVRWKVRLYFQIRDRNFFLVSPAQNVCATFFVLCAFCTTTKICLCLEIRLPSSSKSFSFFFFYCACSPKARFVEVHLKGKVHTISWKGCQCCSTVNLLNNAQQTMPHQVKDVTTTRQGSRVCHAS